MIHGPKMSRYAFLSQAIAMATMVLVYLLKDMVAA